VSDTSLVFNVLVRDKASEAFRRLKSSASDVSTSISKVFARRSDAGQISQQIDQTKSKIKSLAEEFDRTGNKNLFKDMRRQASDLKLLEQAARNAGDGGFRGFVRASDRASQAASGFASAAAGAAPFIAGIGAAALLAVPGITTLLGVLAAGPALLAGLGAAGGALGLGFLGLSDAFKKTASAGGGAIASTVDRTHQLVQANHQLEQAERQVSDAQRQSLAAQKALDQARKDAAHNIAELTRNLADARLDEEAAVLGVADAEQSLSDTRANPKSTLLDVQKADLAYRQSKQTLEDVRARLADVADAQRDAAQKGVEGSDQVTQAYEAEEKASVALTEAQYSLAEAQYSLAHQQTQAAAGAGAAASAMMKLAPAAQQVVAAIKRLQPAFESLRLDVQQKLFAGIGAEITSLARAWIPQLHTSLGGMATTFNGVFKTFADTTKDPAFIQNIATGIEGVRGVIDKVGQAVAGPLTQSFGTLAGASTPIFQIIGDKLAGIVTQFAAWLQKANESGALQKFMKEAAANLGAVFDFLKKTVVTLADTFQWLQKHRSVVEPLAVVLGTVAAAIYLVVTAVKIWTTVQWALNIAMDANPVGLIILGIAALVAIIFLLWTHSTGFRNFFIGMWDHIWGFLKSVGAWFAGPFANFFVAGYHAVMDSAGAAVDWIHGKWSAFINFFTSLPGKITSIASSMWNGLINAYRTAINFLIRGWNALDFGIHVHIPSWVPTIGGKGFDISDVIPDIPFLSGGGTATQGGLAVVGENGPEIVSLPTGATVHPNGTGPGGRATVRFAGNTDSAFATAFMNLVRTGMIQIDT
jgi:hypothetical protein